MIQPQTVQEIYLNILAAKEKEADLILRDALKKYKQAEQIKVAATRERLAFEEGMGK